MSKFEFIQADDWEVLLKDGKVLYEHHTVSDTFAEAVELAAKWGVTVENLSSREATDEEYDLLSTYGHWGEIPKEELENAQ